jgi:hypothetical protein
LSLAGCKVDISCLQRGPSSQIPYSVRFLSCTCKTYGRGRCIQSL